MLVGLAVGGSLGSSWPLLFIISTLGNLIFLTLGSLRAALVPAVAVPLSLIGGAFIMLLLGYSINLLPLLAMVLAIGLVVDDAIVVVENTERNMTQFGLSPKEAAKRAMSEVSGALIAIVLLAVIRPV